MMKSGTKEYNELHYFIRKNKPKPEFCEGCGEKTHKLDIANISGNYLRDINDYRWLCRLCHFKSDGRFDNLKQGRNRIEKYNQDITSGRKVCIYCHEEKPICEFSLNKRRKSGYQSYCKKCNKQKSKEYKLRYLKTHDIVQIKIPIGKKQQLLDFAEKLRREEI